jgi:hypothetical protein
MIAFATDSRNETPSQQPIQRQMDRWMEEQVFEEDVRAVLAMMRPNRRERLMGWHEHRTGGRNFRVTVSWDDDSHRANADGAFNVPQMAEVLEAVLVGSAKSQDRLRPCEEFELYRGVVRELSRRLDEMQTCYE